MFVSFVNFGASLQSDLLSKAGTAFTLNVKLNIYVKINKFFASKMF